MQQERHLLRMPKIPLAVRRAASLLFPNDVERTYDRSIERFIKTYQKRGLE
jgi:hypothetical protein